MLYWLNQNDKSSSGFINFAYMLCYVILKLKKHHLYCPAPIFWCWCEPLNNFSLFNSFILQCQNIVIKQLFFVYANISYNALERREVCKGGKEVSKKSAPSQSSSKSSASVPKQATHNGRKTDASHTNTTVKAPRPSSSGGHSSVNAQAERTMFEQQVTKSHLSANAWHISRIRDLLLMLFITDHRAEAISRQSRKGEGLLLLQIERYRDHVPDP